MARAAPHTVALFDIDSTLLALSVNGAVLAQALDAATGVPGLLDRIDAFGHTDRWICAAAARVAGLPDGERDADRLYARYAACYTRALSAALATLPASALPGAAALLEALAARDDVAVGIATGNARANAALKLAHAGLNRWFDPLRGGFGDRHDDRAAVVREGARECGWTPGTRLVVIGDTTHDVRAALAAGATAVAVATGHVDAGALRDAGAETVLDSLEDRDAAVAAIVVGAAR